MTGKTFFSAWIQFIDGFVSDRMKSGKTLSQLWHERGAWTHGTIGPAHARCAESPFGDHLVGLAKYRLDDRPWRYQKECRSFDLVLTRHANMPLPYLWTQQEQAHWDAQFRPEALDIVIEQEDSCGIAWQEMLKLVHVRASLKVLVTYASDVNGRGISIDRSAEHIENTKAMFQGMSKRAWQACPENTDTEYVLIIGQLDELSEQPEVLWHAWSFAASGAESRTVHEEPVGVAVDGEAHPQAAFTVDAARHDGAVA